MNYSRVHGIALSMTVGDSNAGLVVRISPRVLEKRKTENIQRVIGPTGGYVSKRWRFRTLKIKWNIYTLFIHEGMGAQISGAMSLWRLNF